VDLNTVEAVLRPRARAALPARDDGDLFLAGGTWVFSEPQAGAKRLVDLTALGWPPLAAGDQGLCIAATCTLAALEAFAAPKDWRAAPIIGQCCRALLGSFKIRAVATVGGNLCLALPAAPMAALVAALNGTCTIWDAAGGERLVPARDFITGARQTVLRPGEILRSVMLPADSLRRQAAFRQMSLTMHGRSAALLVGTIEGGVVELTLTGSVPRPVRLAVPAGLGGALLQDAVAAAVERHGPGWYDDIHGRPAWRRRITLLMAEDICCELGGGGKNVLF
jgi:CO/xanthine dehydrogenase FAD-binding subunit